MQQLWLITVPNNKESSERTFTALSSSLSSHSNSIKLYKFDIPPLSVGTLDSLLALSDDLNKINTQVENVVRKVERQYFDLEGVNGKPLKVNERSVQAYLKRFSWDNSQYQFQGKPLIELVSQIQGLVGKVDDELKAMATAYTEKNLSLATTQRKKLINLTSSDFEDFLKPEDIARLDLQDTDNLLTLMVTIPKSAESEFLESYSTLGEKIAFFGGPDWTNSSSLGQNDGNFGKGVKRSKVKGSPVVPKSAKKVADEGEYVMYAVTILKGHYEAGSFQDDVFIAGTFVDYVEPVKAAFREKRYQIRDFSYDPSKAGGIDGQIKQSKEELSQNRKAIVRWSITHFGEVFNAWIHLKVIRAFVESVLLYGLPVDNVAFFLEPDLKNEKKIRSELVKSVLSIRPELHVKINAIEGEENSDDYENLPFLCHPFTVIGSS
eukprot:gene9428-12704_t